MITEAELAHWQRHAPWPTLEQVEQDLVLSRMIVEIANHPLLGAELVFRGGTCLHKVWLDRPWRYSEDLDYVRRTPGGVGEVLDAIREVAAIVGFDRGDARTPKPLAQRLAQRVLGTDSRDLRTLLPERESTGQRHDGREISALGSV